MEQLYTVIEYILFYNSTQNYKTIWRYVNSQYVFKFA